jgi:hypothetical protein
LQWNKLRALGFVPTPAPLARELAAATAPGGVLDPACGEGDLLLAAWEAAGRDPAVARRLYGLELDPERARRARRRVRRVIGGPAGAAAARGIRCADALLDAAWPAGTAVVANPPWVSLSGRQRGVLPPGRGRAYRAAYRSMAGWPSLHGAFLERIARHVAQHGTLARVLVPAPTCDRPRYAPARAAVDALCAVRWVRALAAGELPGVVETAVVLELVPGPTGRTGGRWEPGPSPADAALLAELAACPRLPPACFADVGVHTGNAARVLVRRAGGDAPEQRGAPGRPLREGRDLRPFRLGAARATLHVPAERSAELRYRVAPLARHRAVPILVRQTADRPIAARHTDPEHFRNTLLACAPPRALAPEAVVALLNSELLARWHRASFADARQAAFPQVKVRHLRALPFPWLDRAAAPRRHDELAELGHALESAGGAHRDELTVALEVSVRRAFRLSE